MKHTEPPHKPLRYRHVQALVCNLDHPKASVRIASLRAATRLAGLEDVVSPDVRENMLSQVERRLALTAPRTFWECLTCRSRT